MGSTYRCELHLRCDNAHCTRGGRGQACEVSYDDMDASPQLPTKDRLREIAEKDGWLIFDSRNKAYCPRCRKLNDNQKEAP